MTPAAPTPGLVEAGVHGEAVEPGPEPVRVAQPGQVPPGSDHRILDGVARELRVPEDEPGGRVQPRERRVDERDEGVMIAPLRPFDECSLVHGHPSMRRDSYGRAQRVGVSMPQKVPDSGLGPSRPED